MKAGWGGMFEGAPLVLLSTTTGARTGRPHTNPAAYQRDGERILVFASNAGGPKNPDWSHNLLAGLSTAPSRSARAMVASRIRR